MKYLNTIEAKGGVLFDSVKDFEFEQVRPGFLYFDDNIGNDSANDSSHVVPALKLKVYNTPSTGYAAPSKTNFHYILTSYLSKDINNTGNAVAGGLLKAVEGSSSELPLSKVAANNLKKDDSNTMVELRRVNLEQGRITNAQIVPIYDSELVTKKWVESKLGSFTMKTKTAGVSHLDSAENAEGIVLEASEVDFYLDTVQGLTSFLANPNEVTASGEFERAIPLETNLTENLITVYVPSELIIGAAKYLGAYRVSAIALTGPAESKGALTITAMSSPLYFKEPTYALSVYELSTDNYSSIVGQIRFDLTANGADKTAAEAAAASMMGTTKIAGPKDNNAYARVTCIGEDGSYTFLTYKYSGTAWVAVTADLPSKSYKQVFPDISYIEIVEAGKDTVYKLQLGFAVPLAKGAKFYVAYAG